MSLLPTFFPMSSKFYPHEIANSMLIESTVSDCFLYRTPAANGNLKKWTLSFWVKITGSPDDYLPVLGCAAGSSDSTYGQIILSSATSGLAYKFCVDGYYISFRRPSALFRDPSGWYHFTVVWDTAQAVTEDRIRVYINGIKVTAWATNNTPAQNADSGINRNSQHRIGAWPSGVQHRTRGYLADVHFLDGIAAEPSEFGKLKKGVWIPKAYTGSYGGANGFYLKFLNSGSLGADSSGNGNTFTATGGPQQTADTPTNNHCVMSGAIPGTKVLRGGLRTQMDGSNTVPAVGTFFVDITDPKGWAWKCVPAAIPWGVYHGIIRRDQVPNINPSSGGACVGQSAQLSNGEVYYNGTYLGNFGGTMGPEVGSVMEYLMRSGCLYIRKNGVWVNGGNPVVTGLTGLWGPWCNAPAGYTHLTDWDFGQLGYTPPGEFKTLCARNLTETILTSGVFIGNASTDGPVVFTNGPLDTLTINGNAVTWGTHAIRLANGFKLITSSSSYNTSGTNNWTATTSQKPFKFANAQIN